MNIFVVSSFSEFLNVFLKSFSHPILELVKATFGIQTSQLLIFTEFLQAP